MVHEDVGRNPKFILVHQINLREKIDLAIVY
jgi:hypothetical protein